MPRDVTTQWNLTFDMLHFALQYCKPLEKLTAAQDLKLHRYELSKEEWGIVKDLQDILEVCFHYFYLFKSKIINET